MFTGIIEDIGEIIKISNRKLTIKTNLTDIKPGDSISINGVCLTVIEKKDSFFEVEMSKETYYRTNLNTLKIGDKVNLERALKVNDRFGGHFVTGHIESTTKIETINYLDKTTLIYEFSTQKSIIKNLVQKGSVCLDGVSLTIADIKDTKFSIFIVPYTLENTTFKFKKIGDKLNLEIDLLAKYIEGIITAKSNRISYKFLEETGFFERLGNYKTSLE